MTHTLPEHLLRQRVIRVTVIGCGGNGSVIAMGLPYIHQALLLQGHSGGLEVTLIDGDVISQANCIRQPFTHAEIGLNKATVLVSRINLFWGLQWKAIPENVSKSHRVGEADLVIGCVDTRSARAEIQTLVGGDAVVTYWLDLGNGADGGQFVLGQPRNRRNARRALRLRTVVELFPEITDESRGEADGPSCSSLEALERQEPFVNQTLASHSLALLARLFRYRELPSHGAFVSISNQRVQPLEVDRVRWKKAHSREMAPGSALAGNEVVGHRLLT